MKLIDSVNNSNHCGQDRFSDKITQHYQNSLYRAYHLASFTYKVKIELPLLGGLRFVSFVRLSLVMQNMQTFYLLKIGIANT